jgi:hypothetical protein
MWCLEDRLVTAVVLLAVLAMQAVAVQAVVFVPLVFSPLQPQAALLIEESVWTAVIQQSLVQLEQVVINLPSRRMH